MEFGDFGDHRGTLCGVWPSWYPSRPLVTTPSQADIQADQSSPRDLLEYFLSGLGETSLPVIQQQVQRYEQENQGLLIDSSLFAQYVQYKAALSELTLPQASGAFDPRVVAIAPELVRSASSLFFC